MFENELRQHLNASAEVVTNAGTFAGILVNVDAVRVTVRVPQYPGYGGAEDVTVDLISIAYVRIFA